MSQHVDASSSQRFPGEKRLIDNKGGPAVEVLMARKRIRWTKVPVRVIMSWDKSTSEACDVLVLLHLTIAYRPPADRAGIKAIACCPRVSDDQQHKASLKGRLFSVSSLLSTSWLESQSQWNLSGALPSGFPALARLDSCYSSASRRTGGYYRSRMVQLSLARKVDQKEKKNAFGGALWLNWRAKPPPSSAIVLFRRRRK